MAHLLRKLHENRVRFPARSERTIAGPRLESFSRPCRIMVLYVLAIVWFCSASQHATPRAAVLCNRPQSPSVFVPDQRHTPLAYLCLNATPGRVIAGNPFFSARRMLPFWRRSTMSTFTPRGLGAERLLWTGQRVVQVLTGRRSPPSSAGTAPRAPAPTPTPCVSIMKLSHTNK